MEQILNNERNSTMNETILDLINYNENRDLQTATLRNKKTTGWSEDGTEKNLTVLTTFEDAVSQENRVSVQERVHGVILLNTVQAINFNEEVVVNNSTISLSIEDAERLIGQLQTAVKNAR